ncbi:unnamed protein product [Tenebrio molitor]|nr:unnamed protein product [Tenebrio molitor]
MLLREVLAANPFENANEWNNIKKKLIKETTKKISRRAVREHTEHLLKLFKKSAQICESKSGTEEQYAEKEQLLQQVTDLQREFANCNKKKKKSFKFQDLREVSKTRDMAATSQASNRFFFRPNTPALATNQSHLSKTCFVLRVKNDSLQFLKEKIKQNLL